VNTDLLKLHYPQLFLKFILVALTDKLVSLYYRQIFGRVTSVIPCKDVIFVGPFVDASHLGDQIPPNTYFGVVNRLFQA